MSTCHDALAAARDALAAFGKQAGYLPEQGGYSTRMTENEKQLADAVASLDEIIAGGSIVGRLRADAAQDGLALAYLVVEYFGDGEIEPFLDGDIKLRDAARALIAKAEGQS